MSSRAPRIRSIDCPRNDDQRDLVFNVSLSGAASEKSKVRYTFSGSARRGHDYDEHCNVSFDHGRTYRAVKGNEIEVPAGVCGFKVKVHTHVDVESKRVDTISLHASLNGGSTHGTGTICDRSLAPLGVRGVSSPVQSEGDALEFDVALSAAARSTTRVQLAVNDGTAKATSDYSTAMQVSFDGGKTYKPVVGDGVDVPAGASGFKVKVASIEDRVVEANELFSLKASVNGSSASGTATIVNDDSGDIKVVSVTGQDVVEGNHLVFKVNLEGGPTHPCRPAGSSCPPEQWTCTSGGGKGTIDLGDYKITVTEHNSVWILTNKSTGISTRIWGDPHVDEGNDGRNDFDFKKDMTFQLADGTKITVETVAWGTSGQTLSSKLTITDWCSKNAMVVSGLGWDSDGVNNLKVEKFEGEGRVLDLATDDGAFTLYETASCAWQVFDGRPATQSLVNQLEAGTLINPGTAVTLALADGTAVRTQDYQGKIEISLDEGRTWNLVDAVNVVNVPTGTDHFLARVPTIDDKVVENRETLTLQATAKAGSATGIGGILDNDACPVRVHCVSSAQANEGDPLTFSVGLSGSSNSVTQVTLLLSNGSATEGQDYKASGLMVSFDGGRTFQALTGSTVDVPAGVSGFKVKVQGLEDTNFEGNETFTLKATANGGSAQGIGTICEDDAAVRVVSVGAAQANEGDPLTFAVALSGTSTSATTVALQLTNGSATAGQDYAATGLQVSFDGGRTFAPITGNSVSVPAGVSGFSVKVGGLEDTVFEGNESFTLQASANGGSAQGIGTICDDDAAVRVIGVSSAHASEGDDLKFTVTLSGQSTSATQVNLQLANGSATGGQDFATTGLQASFDGGRTFVAINGTTVTVPAGAQGFVVKVGGLEDSVHEGKETFTLQASTNGSTAQGIGTICDDDAAVRVVGVSSTQANEGDPLTFAVTLSGAAASATTVALQLSNGTATAGQDYAATGLQVSFDGGNTFTAVTGNSVSVPAGATGFYVKVGGLEDSVHEGNETFTLQASGNGSTAQGIGTICDDDAAPRVVSVGAAQANEGDPLTFDVVMSGVSTTATTVALQLASGTAETGRDFATTGLTVSFDGGQTFSPVSGTSVTVPAGASGFKLRVPSIEDSSVEGNETFTLQASANGATASGTGTILDDDKPINPNDVSFKGDTRIVEGNPAHVFTVKLVEPVTEDTWVTVRIGNGTAQRTDGDGNGQNYVKDQATLDGWKNILTTATAGTSSLTKDFTVYGSDGQAVAGDTVRVLIRAGSSESEAYSVRAWQETQRVAQLGSALEGNEEFRMEVTTVGTQTLAQPAASTVTVVDNHVQLISPIIIDLNGDGVQTTAMQDSQARFDMDLDGVKDRTGWVSAQDAFLAVDNNLDGTVNDRSELFGGQIGEGFAKLASFDSNADGQVDAGDERFAELKLWQDRDGDGTTDQGELITLNEAGIASLRVSYELRAEDQNGNLLLERSDALTSDGRSVEVADAYFAVDSGADAPRLADLLSDGRDDEIPLGGLVPAAASTAAGTAPVAKPMEALVEANLDLEHLLHKPQTSSEGA